jgi:hypothetical protein
VFSLPKIPYIYTVFQPLYLSELPLAEGILTSDMEGMQGTVHNAPWQKINSED